MALNKIRKWVRWITNHLTYCLVIIYFVILIALCIISHFNVGFNFNKVLKTNEPIVDLFVSSLGIGSAIILYNKYLAKKQHEAVFGFYANMRVFLKRLNVFLGDNFSQATIMVKLYTKSALASSAYNAPSEEYIDAFRNLCCEFLNFLSDSKDNVPAKRGNEDFVKWFNSQISIVELLQKGALFTTNYYGDCPNKEKLEVFYNKIKNDINYIDSSINQKIEDDSFKS